MRTAALLVLFLLAPASGRAQPLADGGRATVTAVVDGDTVVLNDGRQVRLPGLQAPKLPLGRKGFREWPLAKASKAHLEKLVLNRPVTLRFGGARRDRHGRTLAHLFRDDGGGAETWIQGAMLEAGMARLYTFPDNRALVDGMRLAERKARDARRGMWSLDHYRVRAPDGLARDIGTFQIVAGTIADAAKVKGTVYLNFGADWRSDFTVRIKAKALRLFAKAGLDPAAWKGRAVEVRGWLTKRNGPMITATHPEQIALRMP